MATLFGLLPLALTLAFERPPVIPPLLLAFAVCLAVLRRDRSFERDRLWNRGRIREALPGILVRLLAGGSLLALATASRRCG